MATYDDELIAAGIRRRSPNAVIPATLADAANMRAPVARDPADREAAVVNATSQSARAFDSGIRRFGAIPAVLYGAGANLVSEGAGDAAIESGIELQRRAAELGPEIESSSQVTDVGSGLAFARNKALESIPDVALAIAGGGVGGGIVKSAARRAATRAAEGFAERQVARRGIGELAADSVAAQGEDAARRVATAEAVEAATAKAAPRFARAAEASLDGAVRNARAAGAVAGQYPSVVASSAEGAPDASGELVGGLKGASREATGKILLGDLGAAALGAAPEVRLLSRIGGAAAREAIAKNAQAILPRVAKEAAKQGALGAGLGVAQTAAQYAAHKWVNDNVDLISPSAFQSYLDSAVAGGALGAGLSGAIETTAATGARVSGALDGSNPQVDALRSRIRENLSTLAKKRDAAFEKAKGTYESFFAKDGDAAGEPVAGIGPEGEPVDAGPAKSATETAVDIGTKVGEGAAKLHTAAIDVFKRLHAGLTTEEGKAATTGAFADAVDSAKGAFDTAPIQAGIDAVLKSYKSALDRAKTPEGQKDVQTAYGKIIGEIHDSNDVGGTFEDNLNRLADDGLLDDRAGSEVDALLARQNAGEADVPSPSTRFPAQNPVKLGSKLQDQLATAIPIDSPFWGFPEQLQSMVGSAEKMLLGQDLDAADFRRIDTLRQIAPDQVRSWEANAGDFARRAKGAADEAIEADTPAPRNTAMADELKTALKDRDAGGTDYEAALHGIRERGLDDLSTRSLTDSLVEAKPGTPEHTELQGALRARLFKEGGADGKPLTENLASPKSRALWEKKDPTKNANTIGIGKVEIESNGRKIQRQQALQLDNLVSRKLREDPGIGPRSALGQVLGDLHMAGIKIEPATITEGVYYTESDGTTHALSASDVAAIKNTLRPPRAIRPLPQARAPRTRVEKPEVTKAAKAKAVLEPEPIAEQQGETDNRVAGPERVPRKAPPKGASGVKETPASKGNVATSTLKPIADVQVKGNPYEAIMTRARKEREALVADPKARAAAAHRAGVEIGKAELKRQLEGGDGQEPTLSGQAYRRALARLEDYESGASRKYLRDAFKGKFDSAKVREVSAENEAPLINEAREETQLALNKAYRNLTGELKKPSRKEVQAKIDELLAKPAKELSGKERTLLTAARDRGLIKREESAHPDVEVINRKKAENEKATKDDEGRLADTDDIDNVDATIRKILADDSTHDLKRETQAINAVLKKLGIKRLLKVTHLPDSDFSSKGGDYSSPLGEIRLNRNLHGAERVEVLAHELGHHVIRSELADAMGVDIKELHGLSPSDFNDLLAKHKPELHAEVMKDFEAWRDDPKNSSMQSRALEVMASRKPFHRAATVRGNKSSATLGDLIKDRNYKQIDYIHQFEEYFADQISRALTADAKTPAQKFFKGIADKLKLVYDTLFTGKGGKDYAPAPSVEKWIQSLYDRNTMAVAEALGEPTVPKVVAESATAAALHAAAAGLPSAVPPGSSPPTGGSPPPAAPLPPKGLKALVKFIRYRMPADTRAVLDQALSRGKSVRALNEIYKDQPGALKAMRDPEHGLEARIAYAYLAHQAGTFKGGPKGTSALRNLGDDLLSIANLAGSGAYAERIFTDIANGRIEAQIARGKTYDVKAREAAYRGKAQAAFNQAQDVYQAVRRPLAKAFDSSIARMRDTGVPAIRRVGALLQRHTGEAGEDPGLAPAVTHVTDRTLRTAGRIFEGLSERETLHAVTALQRQDATHHIPKVAEAIKKTRALFDELYKYGKGAGLFDDSFVPKDNYFPVVMDLRTPADVGALKKLLSDPRFEAKIREVSDDSTTPIDKIVDRLVMSAQGAANSDAAGIAAPAFNAKNRRVMDFVYELGTPEQIKTFAGLQSKSPADIFSGYVQPLIREAEYARRFGKDGAKLDALLADAKRQGASDEQIAQATAAVNGAMGRVGIDGSPTIRAVFGKGAAERFKGPGVRKGIALAQAYENARLLPLALISSLVDPMGIAVRTGGDFKTAWKGFKTGISSLVNKQTKAEISGMLQALGSADDFLASDILASNFGSKEGGTSRSVNDFIFKANGLAAWTKTTRFMALAAAHGFLSKHADGSTPSAKRYLDELGIRPGDVTTQDGKVKILTPAERKTATPAQRAADDRVRNGLLRFVDESVLRPTSQQAPNWFADPYVGLVTQYKHFAYAIADQIGKRIAHEVKHGNRQVLLPAMSYLPIIILSEMLRGGLQYGPDGNPNRKDWGPEEYTTYALDRSGLLGPKISFQSDVLSDSKHGNIPGTSLLGPTFQQATDVVRGRATLEGALPGQALYKHWNDEARVAP